MHKNGDGDDDDDDNRTATVAINLDDCNNGDDASVAPKAMQAAPQQSSFLSLTEIQRGRNVQKINMLRSPSRESVGTDISLFSVSTLASELTAAGRMKLLSVKIPSSDNSNVSRGPSPNVLDSKRLKTPLESIRQIWIEDTRDMIKGMAALSSIVGVSKSFSTSDIVSLSMNSYRDEDSIATATSAAAMAEATMMGDLGGSAFSFASKRNAVSELAINSAAANCAYLLRRSLNVECSSRTCSTWVAVGDMSAAASPLPSPYGGGDGGNTSNGGGDYLSSMTTAPCPSKFYPRAPAFSAADLVRSVNKKIRQHYIRRRLLNTYKALERLSQSEFNLDKLEMEAAASSSRAYGGNATGSVDIASDANDISAPIQRKNLKTGLASDRISSKGSVSQSNRLSVPVGDSCGIFKEKPAAEMSATTTATNGERRRRNTRFLSDNVDERLTVNDVERERGQPLSKYDRNMMIFNWLLTLESEESLTTSSGGNTLATDAVLTYH